MAKSRVDALADRRQCLREGNEARILGFVADRRPALVVAILLAAAIVPPGRLDVALRVRRNPDVRPRRRDGQLADTGQRFLVLDPLALRRAVAEALRPAPDAADAGLGVADVGELRFPGGELWTGKNWIEDLRGRLQEQRGIPKPETAG